MRGIYAATSETHFVHQSSYTDGGERREHASRKKGRSERAGEGGAKGWAMGARAGQTFYRCSEQDGADGRARGARVLARARSAAARGREGCPTSVE